MIISDINYIQSTNEEVFGGYSFYYSAKKEQKVEAEFDFDSKVDKDKYVDVYIDVYADLDIKGNYAEVGYEIEAIGKDTIAEHDFALLAVENKLSSAAGNAIAAVD
ncbi:MAG: hypothetical protein QNJ47_00315 [Nostocaceae cyanobacterium]|nr:hypothetical protein [Nostocaceae cyanobacterium]